MKSADVRPRTAAPAGTGGSLYWAASDAAAMIGRSLRHATRNLDSLLMGVILPIVLLLMFVYVFGGAISTGTEYIDYVVPGIILVCAGFGSATTAVSVCTDMVGGMTDRFRSLAIHSSSVLTGHVVASVARSMLSTALVIGVALALGFRPNATPAEWLAAAGVIALFVLAISWVAAALGLLVDTPDAANGATFGFLFLPYVSSAFAPTDTMPRALQVFADYQPVTPVIETVRGLLMGTPIGTSAWLAVAWCVGILVVAQPAAVRLFRRNRAH